MKPVLMCHENRGALTLRPMDMFLTCTNSAEAHQSRIRVHGDEDALLGKDVIIQEKHAKTVLLCLMCVRAPWRASRQNQRHGVTAHKAQERCLRMRLVSGTGPGGACTRLTSMADNQTG